MSIIVYKTVSEFKTAVFWDVGPCSLVEVDRRFVHAYCPHHQGCESSSYSSP
jgi:hypothetical protein